MHYSTKVHSSNHAYSGIGPNILDLTHAVPGNTVPTLYCSVPYHTLPFHTLLATPSCVPLNTKYQPCPPPRYHIIPFHTQYRIPHLLLLHTVPCHIIRFHIQHRTTVSRIKPSSVLYLVVFHVEHRNIPYITIPIPYIIPYLIPYRIPHLARPLPQLLQVILTHRPQLVGSRSRQQQDGSSRRANALEESQPVERVCMGRRSALRNALQRVKKEGKKQGSTHAAYGNITFTHHLRHLGVP